MNDFAGMEGLVRDFLTEASDLLSGIDGKLISLEKAPHDRDLLNVIFRGFHTINGGAGFLNATELIALCHLAEGLFDKLRNGELALDAELMDIILAATGEIRQMFDVLAQGRQPEACPAHLIASLHAVLGGRPAASVAPASARMAEETRGTAATTNLSSDEPDWSMLYQTLVGVAPAPLAPAAAEPGRSVPRAAAMPGGETQPAGSRENEAGESNIIRVDKDRLDQVLNLSGEIGLAKNRLAHLRSDMLLASADTPQLRALDQSVNQLDMLVVSLQNAVMRMRMQPIGRLFSEYPHLARDLAHQLGKDVELVLSGEETEIDKTAIDNLNDLLVPLIRNAVTHGVEKPEQRAAAGKPAKGRIHLGARQEGGCIRISVADDGKGMRPEAIRSKAVEKGLISAESANSLDDAQSLSLIFLPGFSSSDRTLSVSGHDAGVDRVKANIQKLNGAISIASEPGRGSEFTISLPLTSAMLPVLLLRLCNQSFAVPLSLVREILQIAPGDLQQVSGKPAMIVRDEVLPVLTLASLIGWEQAGAQGVGVLMQVGGNSFILTAESFIGRDDVVIKPLDTFRPHGVIGATLSSEGEIVLILDINELLGEVRG